MFCLIATLHAILWPQGQIETNPTPHHIMDCRSKGHSGRNVFQCTVTNLVHDDVIKWEHFLRYWPFLRGIHRSHKDQWRGVLMFSLICGWVNNREAGDLIRHRAHYDVIVMRGIVRTKCKRQKSKLQSLRLTEGFICLEIIGYVTHNELWIYIYIYTYITTRSIYIARQLYGITLTVCPFGCV